VRSSCTCTPAPKLTAIFRIKRHPPPLCSYIATERGKVLRWQPVTKELLDLEVCKRSDDCIHGMYVPHS
jgi:hypothetical protein